MLVDFQNSFTIGLTDKFATICTYVATLPVSVKWLAVKTASEMTYTVPGGALNSTQTKPLHYLVKYECQKNGGKYVLSLMINS